jgi:8-oxo-dGTP pyrophosphatase MutT (NUDIX family)
MAERPRILDPKGVPVHGTDAHLPPVAPDRLLAPQLRQRFGMPPPWQPEFPGDGAQLDRQPSPASVLVPLVQRPHGLQVLLTQRTDHLHDHAGQISFPGGRAEDSDADEVATALREADEEIGLRPQAVEVIGRLPTYTTITRFVVTPVVGVITPPFDLKRQFLSMPWRPPADSADADREYFIWGATAAMLRNLYRFLAA